MNAEAFKDAKAEIEVLSGDPGGGPMRIRFEGYVCGFMFCDACRHQAEPHTIDAMAWAGLVLVAWRLLRRWQARRIIRDTIENAWLQTMEDL